MSRAKNITLCAVLTACALALSLFERTIPLGIIVPLPGIKLGLANIVTLIAVLCIGKKQAASILALRILLLYLMTGSITSLAMSVCGGFFAFAAMLIFSKGYGKHFSVFGISIASASAHNIGQIAAACVIMKTTSVIYYLPLLLITACVTGALTATASLGVIKFMQVNYNNQK